jgi:hypothetical protein
LTLDRLAGVTGAASADKDQRRSRGRWCAEDCTLSQLVSKNTDFAVVVRVSEARDVGEQARSICYKLYDHAKNMLTAPPNMLLSEVSMVIAARQCS